LLRVTVAPPGEQASGATPQQMIVILVDHLFSQASGDHTAKKYVVSETYKYYHEKLWGNWKKG